MNWRAGITFGLVAFLLVCGWWMVKGIAMYVEVGDLNAVASHSAMADPSTILSRGLIALLAAVPVGAYLGGRAGALVEEALEENEGFALMAAEIGEEDSMMEETATPF